MNAPILLIPVYFLHCATLQLANGIDDGEGLDNEMKDVFRTMDAKEYLWGSCLQIAVLATYHQGRDTHIRQVSVHLAPFPSCLCVCILCNMPVFKCANS